MLRFAKCTIDSVPFEYSDQSFVQSRASLLQRVVDTNGIIWRYHSKSDVTMTLTGICAFSVRLLSAHAGDNAVCKSNRGLLANWMLPSVWKSGQSQLLQVRTFLLVVRVFKRDTFLSPEYIFITVTAFRSAAAPRENGHLVDFWQFNACVVCEFLILEVKATEKIKFPANLATIKTTAVALFNDVTKVKFSMCWMTQVTIRLSQFTGLHIHCQCCPTL
jgi:hypothetical protein